MKRTLNFRFKGGRDYVHGTDMFNAMLGHLREYEGVDRLNNVDFSIHQKTSKNLEIDECAADETTGAVAALRGIDLAGARRYWTLRTTETDAAGRYPYDEDGLVAGAILDEHARSLAIAASTHSFIETVVALNKSLLLRLYPAYEGRWLFTRIQLGTSQNLAPAPHTVRLVRNANFVLAKSELSGMGTIYFSGIKAD